MSGFFTIQEGARKKIILIAALFLLAAAITIVNLRRGSSSAEAGIALKCRACDHADIVTDEQFQTMINQQNESYIQLVAQRDPPKAEKLRQLVENPDQAMNPMSRREMDVSLPPWGTRNWPLPCPQCNQNALFNAIKCPDCEEIFFGDCENGYPIRVCPKCKYNLKSKK